MKGAGEQGEIDINAALKKYYESATIFVHKFLQARAKSNTNITTETLSEYPEHYADVFDLLEHFARKLGFYDKGNNTQHLNCIRYGIIECKASQRYITNLYNKLMEAYRVVDSPYVEQVAKDAIFVDLTVQCKALFQEVTDRCVYKHLAPSLGEQSNTGRASAYVRQLSYSQRTQFHKPREDDTREDHKFADVAPTTFARRQSWGDSVKGKDTKRQQ